MAYFRFWLVSGDSHGVIRFKSLDDCNKYSYKHGLSTNSNKYHFHWQSFLSFTYAMTQAREQH